MRSMEMSAKTVEAAVQAACEALGVDRDDINVSYEVLEFPTRKLFKTIPAKVLVKVEEPEAARPRLLRKSLPKFPPSRQKLLKSPTRPPPKSRKQSLRIWSRPPSWPRLPRTTLRSLSISPLTRACRLRLTT